MEQLNINNFLSIKNAEMDIGKINLLIGPQATGKSVIAKLVYFFREFLNTTYLSSVKDLSRKREVEKEGRDTFEKFFPKYTWSHQDFKITYRVNDIEVSISKSKSSRGQSSLKLDYSPVLVSLHRKLKSTFKKKMSSYEKKEQSSRYLSRSYDAYRYVVEEDVYSKTIGNCFHSSLFIPAGRSFFANLQKNVFHFLADSIEIDPFLINFGSRYETAKRHYDDDFLKRHPKSAVIRKKVENLVQNILVGKYKYEDEKDWIEHKKSKVNLTNASSGQQEALPMLLILYVFPFIGSRASFSFFIEEPEAHLFPVSQKHIVSIIALIYRTMGNGFFITTHSPYILTAINNLIMANDIVLKKGIEGIAGIVDPDHCISFDDVTAYTLENGELVSIMNKKERLIGASIIDSVSDVFDQEFDSLLKRQMEK